jgi:multidrug resistance efflux pump
LVTVDPDRFEAALRAGHQGLTDLVRQMKEAGIERDEVYAAFEQFRASLRAENREADEDLVMDVMDRIGGWCRPEANLFPDP